MEVVPALSERNQRERSNVSTEVTRGKRPPSPQVTDRVDAPGDVVQQGHADQARPEEGTYRTRQGPPDEPTDGERDRK